MTNLRDIAYLDMAYGLAEKALGRASPNPLVGAVVVKEGRIVGHGYHEGAGRPHAEILALEQARRHSPGSTLYVTLEPCVHWGRTPPCVDTIIKARVKRVVVSALDRNLHVFKKGIQKLREAGLEVDVGLLQERNEKLNEAYIKYITRKIPFVALKAAVSLDGRIATKAFDSRWISSAEMREYIHLLRGEYDSVMIGANTLVRDDPRLTVRHPHWKDKTLTRVVLDSRLRFPLTARILKTLRQGKIIVFTLPGAPRMKIKALERKGVDVIVLPGSSPRTDLREVITELGRREISSLLVEGGSALATSILEARLADKVFLTFSPKLIGGRKALSFLEGQGVHRIKNALRLKKIKWLTIGPDLLFEGYF